MCPECKAGRKCWKGVYCTFAHGENELLSCSVAERIRAAGKAMLELGTNDWWKQQEYSDDKEEQQEGEDQGSWKKRDNSWGSNNKWDDSWKNYKRDVSSDQPD